MWHRLGFTLVVLLTVPLFSGCHGQRYISVDVERDGVPTLHTEYGVSDSLDTAAMWKTLQGQSFRSRRYGQATAGRPGEGRAEGADPDGDRSCQERDGDRKNQ